MKGSPTHNAAVTLGKLGGEATKASKKGIFSPAYKKKVATKKKASTSKKRVAVKKKPAKKRKK